MRALDGIRILELARVAPAELPAMMLADMGAEVLKIETPEPGRAASDEWVRRTIHTFVNRNKRSMTLNMKSPDGQDHRRHLGRRHACELQDLDSVEDSHWTLLVYL